LEDKKEKFKEWKRDKTADAKSKYNKAKKFAKRAVSTAMREASERLMKEMENDKSLKIMFKIAKQSMKDNKDVVGNGCVRDRSGKLCMGERERAKVWKEHMERVMNEENEWDGVVDVDVVHGPIDRVTMKEVMTAIKAMKLGKATGVSEIAAEHIAASGMVGIEVITKIANRVLNGEGTPDEWRCSVLVPLYKGKGDVRDCGAYRGVKLLERAMKVVERVFLMRLRKMVEIDEMQCGFMPGKGTVDALFNGENVTGEVREEEKEVVFVFCGFGKGI
jgi:hypothetical protein